MKPSHQFAIDLVQIQVHQSRFATGEAAGEAVAAALRSALDKKPEVTVIFAAAPSQVEMLQVLANKKDIAWNRVIAFHLDEYVGLPNGASQSFGVFLREHLFDIVNPKVVHYIQPNAPYPDEESRRYSDILRQHLIDIACIGIGDNAHIAFNDPHVADFEDPEFVKVVDLSSESRQQQVNNHCFATLDEVPQNAITVTVPTIFGSKQIFCVVSSASKAKAVRDSFVGPISPEYPASILRRHPNANVFLDDEAARLLLSEMPRKEEMA